MLEVDSKSAKLVSIASISVCKAATEAAVAEVANEA